jgi:hypothetical protein
MTQVHTIARDSAPTSATSTRKPLHPKTVTVFLDAGPSGNKRAAHAVALAQRWDAHLVGVHVVFTSEALHPWDSYAIGERAIQQVIAHEKEVRADDEEVASQVGEQFVDLCSRSDVSCEFRGISWRQPAEDAILNALHSDLVIVGHPQPNGLPGDVSLETIFLASGAPLVVLPNAWHGKAIGDNDRLEWQPGGATRSVRCPELSCRSEGGYCPARGSGQKAPARRGAWRRYRPAIGSAWGACRRRQCDIEWRLNRPSHPRLRNREQLGPARLRSLQPGPFETTLARGHDANLTGTNAHAGACVAVIRRNG